MRACACMLTVRLLPGFGQFERKCTKKDDDDDNNNDDDDKRKKKTQQLWPASNRNLCFRYNVSIKIIVQAKKKMYLSGRK